ncbi:MAG: hypothetical protein AAF721_28395, partial [Myxococcota bacterium]
TTDDSTTDDSTTDDSTTDDSTTDDSTTDGAESESSSSDGATTDGGSSESGSTGGDEEIDVPCYAPEFWTTADPGPWIASVHPPCEDQSITSPSLSANGQHVAYMTFGSPDNPASPPQLAVKDNATGGVVVVPLEDSPVPTGLAARVFLSSDGTTVTFRAVVGAEHSLWAYDLDTETFEQLHVIDDGILSNSYTDVTTSADGQIVAWQQFVEPAGAPGVMVGVMLHDRATSTTTYISAPEEPQAPGGATGAWVSDDGSAVIFSHGPGLFAGVGVSQIYDYDIATGDLSIAVGDDLLGANFRNPVASADASIIAFETMQSLVAADTDNDSDVYIYDRDLAVFELISVTDFGGDEGFGFVDARISGDGEVVVFHYLDPGDPFQVFSRDRGLGQTFHLSLGGDGSALNDSATAYGVSLDGTWVVIESPATNFLAEGTLGAITYPRAYMMLAEQ